MSDLKPCPFCGGEAQVMKMDLDSIDEGWKVWGVWCVNDLHAKDYYNHGHYIDNYPTESEAIAAWNSRADYHGYEQAAIEAWESIKAWNSRAEANGCECEMRRYRNVLGPIDEWQCSECEADVKGLADDTPPNYCPNCGRKVSA